jgi:hypothetical protein
MELPNARGRMVEEVVGVFPPEMVAERMRDSAIRLQAVARSDTHVPSSLSACPGTAPGSSRDGREHDEGGT